MVQRFKGVSHTRCTSCLPAAAPRGAAKATVRREQIWEKAKTTQVF
ncbi:MAG: hypothetical protein QW482_05745 [Thermoproteota archaeon]